MIPLGHDAQIAAFREGAQAGRLHHAWLLAGPSGLGKGLFARAAARWLLAEAAGPASGGGGFAVDPGHRIASLIDAGSHPDYRVLERLEREKTGTARNITIDQVRALTMLFGRTGGLSSRRVVIVDAVDDLEPRAANALLKSLEEPPTDGLFLLVSHAPGRLLPTIRSRCRVVPFAPLDDDVMGQAIDRIMPDLDLGERRALIAAGKGAPGRALHFAGLDIATLDMTIDRLVREGDPTNAIRLALSKSLATRVAQPRYEAFLDRVPSRLAAVARERQGAPLEQAIAGWEAARRIARAAIPLSLDPQATVFEIASIAAGLAPSRDQPPVRR